VACRAGLAFGMGFFAIVLKVGEMEEEGREGARRFFTGCERCLFSLEFGISFLAAVLDTVYQ
jgi:hypothetical protein